MLPAGGSPEPRPLLRRRRPPPRVRPGAAQREPGPARRRPAALALRPHAALHAEVGGWVTPAPPRGSHSPSRGVPALQDSSPPSQAPPSLRTPFLGGFAPPTLLGVPPTLTPCPPRSPRAPRVRRRPVPELLGAMTSACCPLPPLERGACAQEQVSDRGVGAVVRGTPRAALSPVPIAHSCPRASPRSVPPPRTPGGTRRAAARWRSPSGAAASTAPT